MSDETRSTRIGYLSAGDAVVYQLIGQLDALVWELKTISYSGDIGRWDSLWKNVFDVLDAIYKAPSGLQEHVQAIKDATHAHREQLAQHGELVAANHDSVVGRLDEIAGSLQKQGDALAQVQAQLATPWYRKLWRQNNG